MGDLLFAQTRVFDCFFHRQIGIGSGIAHETIEFSIDKLFGVDIYAAADMAAHTDIDIALIVLNAAAALLK